VDSSRGGFDRLLGVSILVLRRDAGREEFLNGVVARLRTDVEQYVEGVPAYPQ
jgi:hypothetical protein